MSQRSKPEVKPRCFDLSALAWTLRGWRANSWNFGPPVPEVGPLPVRVPGSVQQALREAGLLPDWNVGLNSRLCEWVENRHWSFETTIPKAWADLPGRKQLCCAGLDYKGVVRINGAEVGHFDNAFVPWQFDLSPQLKAGDNRLEIIFTDNPRDLGQIGYASAIRDWKPRFNYGWDWVPRLVQVGIWDSIFLNVTDGPQIVGARCWTEGHALNVTASGGRMRLVLSDGVNVLREGEFEGAVTWDNLPVRSWWPNGQGDQPLYTVTLRTAGSGSSERPEVHTWRVGFKSVAWQPCTGAPAGAEPWLCVINGKPVFLQGVNWTPIRPFFADVTETEIRERLEQYRQMGVNLVRVWGGAVLETERFYSLCDEFGIMVWQEFPLSSSGIDNWPPEEPLVIDGMRAIVASYIARRQHHASLLLWCGGNELQGALDGGKTGLGKPVDVSHPMMAAMAEIVRRMDPGRRFLPTSSSGPRFGADPADYGKGVHHDVHGPWNHEGTLDKWRVYWDGDDALFRSETGMPGASSAAMIRTLCGDISPVPCDLSNPVWNHASPWWIQWADYLKQGGDAASLDRFVAWSQARQAEGLAYAAAVTKRRFPACGGFLVWMGHDCFPCPVNTAVVDFNGKLKPAGEALAKVFQTRPDPI